ncbi:MAG: ribosome small subunit-dependent GTPase A [Bacteroidales bacterium]|nr:ribosome small subunit-dependent GTPase A [Bacteroidales bacterium]
MKTLEATVVKNAGSRFYLSELPQWDLFPAVLRGKVRLDAGTSTNPVAVGDRVVCECPDSPSEQDPAVITEILDRRNCLMRKSTNLSRQSHVIATNLDRAVIVVSLYFPEVKLPFLDRELVCCGMYGIPATIVLNKVDLYAAQAQDQVEAFEDIYAKAGYTVIRTSAKSGEGIDALRELCRDNLCLLSGESGVGKSSIVKALNPELAPKVGNISTAHLQGKHTTSLYEMYPLKEGGFIIDTPGLRGFGLVGVEKEEIYTYFPEMLKASENCRFTPCSHTHEPGCGVKAAVDEGLIAPERYNSYLGMLEEDTKFR